MATTTGTEASVTEMLHDLIELDHDASDAYATAIGRLTDPPSKARLQQFKADHDRHVRELGGALTALGAQPPTKGDLKSILSRGKVLLGSLAGDTAILRAMKDNEDDTNTAYERATTRSDLGMSPELELLLSNNLGDERVHRDWIEARISELEREASISP